MSELHTIHLHGALGKKFGKSYRLSVATPCEAIYALSCQIEGFATGIKDGTFRCIVGPRKGGRHLTEATQIQHAFRSGETEFHIVPAIAGRGGRGGGTKILVGIALIALAIAAPYLAPLIGMAVIPAGAAGATFAVTAGISYSASIMALGVMTALGGLAMMLSPQPKGTSPTTANTQNSFTFNGTDNVTQQGGPVPLFYGGPLLIGSVTIEEGLQVYDIPVGGTGSPTDVTLLAG